MTPDDKSSTDLPADGPAPDDLLTDQTLSFRPLTRDDFPLLTVWLREPQVERWWNHETSPEALERDFGPGIRGEEPGEDLVVLLGERPIGLLQRSVVRDYPDEHARFAAHIDVPPGAVELDYLIGDPGLRGHGLGTRLIRAAVEDTWRAHPDAQAVLIAVVAANVASWRAVEKAGIPCIAQGDMPPDNPIDDPLHRIHRIDRPPEDEGGVLHLTSRQLHRGVSSQSDRTLGQWH